jgi:5,6-dimethylbenzimidazole synthase
VSDFSDTERAAVYRVIGARRDVRSQFIDRPVAHETLMRVLAAGHQTPSVGLSQPWRFIIIRDSQIRRAVHASFMTENELAAEAYDGERAATYRRLRLEGIQSAPLNICIISNEQSSMGHGLGRRTMPETARYSTICAIQNIWLAARCEGLGVGWVSILNPEVLRNLLSVPEGCKVIAYLCIGYTSGFSDAPDLEIAGWEKRLALEDVISYDQYRDEE